jgi:small-conductance mechanosensitive channel
MFKDHRGTVLIALAGLVVLAAAGWLLTSEWMIPSLRRISRRSRPAGPAVLVDQRPLTTAENLGALAQIPGEQRFAQEALRLADQDVDLAFKMALRHAGKQPRVVTPEARQIETRVKQQEARVQADQDEVNRLARLVERARGEGRDSLDAQLQAAQAQLALDQDELGDAQRDLERVSGDDHARLQRELEAHEKLQSHISASAARSPGSGGAPVAPGGSRSRSMVAESQHWTTLRAEYDQLLQAQQDAKARAAALSQEHDSLEQKGKAEQPAKAARAQPPASPGATSTSAGGAAASLPRILQRLEGPQEDLGDLDRRIETEQKLGDLYGQWSALVHNRQLQSLHRLMRSAFWIALIIFVVFLADGLASRYFVGLAPDRKRLLSARAVVRFSLRAVGVVLVLLVLFGPPSQLATVLALAGAGLTVALRDFIVGFFGWFVLMGRNGVRPGDWVEINGVQGKVIDVGLLHTVLLETGNWTAAGHPTGRKVTFVNSYAIEGHYFNFSTAGQWLWDELQVGLPRVTDPYPVVAAMEKLVMAETEKSTKLAEQEWQRAATSSGLRSFSAAPAISVRPTDAGVNVTVRYVTRADERVELRSRLYRAVFEFLIGKNVLPPGGEALPQNPPGSQD